MRNHPARHACWRRLTVRVFLLALGLYLLLLLPESAPPQLTGAGRQPFVWNRDQFWSALEREFQNARALGCEALTPRIDASVARMRKWIAVTQASALPSNAPVFDQLETNFFHLAPMVGACPERLPEFLELFGQIRRAVKRQSEDWPTEAPQTRQRLYRALYGARAAVEEVMLQAPRNQLQPLLVCDDEPSATPSAMVRGVTLRSGDILVSRGGAATSALIARGNDFPGNFSHVALVYVDARTKGVSVIEAHIESGVSVRSIEA